MAYKEQEIESIFQSILNEIEQGKALRNILKEEGMPSTQTFYKWIEDNEDKSKRYARACELRAEQLFEDIIDIADDTSGDITYNKDGEEVLNSEFVQRSRVRIDARKWILSKLNPKKYGDKIEQTHKGDLSIKWVEEKTYETPKESE